MKKNDALNRRGFLTRTAEGLGALGFLLAGSGQSQVQSQKYKPGKIITRTLGKTGIRLPVVSMGVMNASLPEVVRRSYDLGVRHFDTAWNYQRGLNERMVGNVIKELGVRNRVTIATKTLIREMRDTQDPDRLKDIFLKRFEESLDRLQMEYVDILYIHDVKDEAQLTNQGILDAMKEIKEQKRARFIGFSTHSNIPAMISLGADMNFWNVILAAYNIGYADDKEMSKALDKAYKKGIGLIAMKTQAGGHWWRGSQPNNDKFINGLNHTAMLKWVLNQKWFTTAIPGYTTLEQMQEDFSVAYDLSYTENEEQFLSDKEIKLGLGFCRQCGTCRNTCPHNVNVPELMRASMYAFQYHNIDQAFATLSEHRNALQSCKDCQICSVQCPNGVAVESRLSALKQLNTVQFA
ncbi:aldo/keto reductase [bacterium]|nr:aldo/keto reductase [bacterium]